MNIPTPCPEIVRDFVQKFGQNENYASGDKALSYLLKQCPANTLLEHVLLKVIAINQLYNTHVLDPYSVARQIVELDVDQRLASSDYTLVADMTPMKVGEKGLKPRHLYSFSTKYCHFHAPERFPIYDSYVGKMLLHFRGINRFDNFKPEELKNYPRFVGLLANFKASFNLDAFSHKELDIYMWLGGKQYFS
ncbi:MAG: hypothetical protein ABSA83_18075 [Verrucomicrobiota bacterium]